MIGNLYIIRNDVNNKVYVGKTYGSIEQRFRERKSDAKNGSECKFHRAIRKYGIENFHIELIAKFEEGLLEQKEIEYIAKYDSYHNGYNSTLGGEEIKRLELDEEAIIEEYKKCLSMNEVGRKIGTTSDSIKKILESNEIEIFIPSPFELSLIAYDLNWNRITKLDSREVVVDFLPKNATTTEAWITRINNAAKTLQHLQVITGRIRKMYFTTIRNSIRYTIKSGI